MDESTRSIDKKRWIIMILVVLVGSTSAFLNCLSVYITPLSERGWDPAIVVMAFTIMMFVSVPGSVLGGKLQQKFGNKLVLIVCGIGFFLSLLVGSLSTNAWMYVIMMGGVAPLFVYCIYVAQIACLGELFPDRRGLSTGAIAVGIFLIGAAIVPVAEWMTRVMEVMHGIVLLGAIIGGFTVLTGFLLIKVPENYRPHGWTPKEYETIDGGDGEQLSGEMDVAWQKLLQLPSFWLILVAMFANATFTSGLMGNFVMLTTSVLATSAATAAKLYSLFAITQGVSGLVLGWVSDKVLGPIKILALVLLVGAITTGVFIVLHTESLTVYAIMIIAAGIVSGSVSALIAVVLMNAYGRKSFGIYFGLMQIGPTVAAFLGPQLAVREPYMNFFIVGFFGLLLSVVLFLIAGKARNKECGLKLL